MLTIIAIIHAASPVKGEAESGQRVGVYDPLQAGDAAPQGRTVRGHRPAYWRGRNHERPWRTAIVTGASQGIGAGNVKAFVERGCNVVANSRKVSESTEVAASDSVALV